MPWVRAIGCIPKFFPVGRTLCFQAVVYVYSYMDVSGIVIEIVG